MSKQEFISHIKGHCSAQAEGISYFGDADFESQCKRILVGTP